MFKVAVFEDITAGTQRRVIFDYVLSMRVISLVSLVNQTPFQCHPAEEKMSGSWDYHLLPIRVVGIN